MTAKRKAKALRYHFWERGLEVLEWAHNRRAELHYLYPERALIGASEEARTTKSWLWSVADEELRYFHLFPRPVSASQALQAFFETAKYEDAGAETYPALAVPCAFVVEAWDVRKLRNDDEVREEMRRYWYYGDWPFKEETRPKADFFAIAWFTKEAEG